LEKVTLSVFYRDEVRGTVKNVSKWDRGTRRSGELEMKPNNARRANKGEAKARNEKTRNT